MSRSVRLLAALGFALLGAGAAEAQPRPDQRAAARAPAKEGERPSPLGNLGNSSKEPIKIDADRLDVFDRENKAVFSGSVVAVQGESTIRCVTLTVFYERNQGQGAQRSAPAAGGDSSAIKRIDCAGNPPAEPVTVVSKDQIATGDNAVFDRVANKIILSGNVALSQCQNVTRGDRMVYDLNTGVANIESKTTGAKPGRVQALFVPGGDDKKGGAQAQAQGCPQPAQAGAAPPAQAAQAKPAQKPAAARTN